MLWRVNGQTSLGDDVVGVCIVYERCLVVHVWWYHSRSG